MRVQTWQLERMPVRKPVSGLYTDRQKAEAKAAELSEEKVFDYRAVRGPRVERSRLGGPA